MHKSSEHLILMQHTCHHSFKKIVHKKTKSMCYMDKHGVSGWYIVPELEHYRCYKVFLARTRSEIIADVVEIPPQNVRMPKRPSIDAAMLAERDLTEALKI